MIQAAHQVEDAGNEIPEVLIVGSGAVGLLMAVDLAKRGLQVTVLEAGPKVVSKESQRFFESAEAVGFPLEGLHLGRFRVLGGTTHFWGGQLVPFAPIVFQDRPWMGKQAAWPLSRADLDPYYDRAYGLVGMQNVMRTDREVLDAMGYGKDVLPKDLDFFFTRWTPEANFARLFAQDVQALPNLRVVTDAPVVALESTDGGKTVAGAWVLDKKGQRKLFKGRQVVLANGTIEIARLLMLPLGSGQAPVWGNNPWLGKGFMDHVDCVVGEVKPLDKKRFHNVFDNVILNRFKYQPKLKLSDKAQANEELLGIACHFIFKSSIAENLANAKIFFKALLKGRLSGSLSELPAQLMTMFAVGLPMIVRYIRYRRIYNPADQGIQLRFTSEQYMSTKSKLTLRGEKDALGMPLVSMTWDVDPRAMKTISRFADKVRAYLKESGLAEVELDPRVVKADPAFLDTIDDANHQMGMTRMALSSDDGVVDAQLRVHATNNLHVAGAAVYPSSGFENPTFTAMALGLRLAEHLARQEGKA